MPLRLHVVIHDSWHEHIYPKYCVFNIIEYDPYTFKLTGAVHRHCKYSKFQSWQPLEVCSGHRFSAEWAPFQSRRADIKIDCAASLCMREMLGSGHAWFMPQHQFSYFQLNFWGYIVAYFLVFLLVVRWFALARSHWGKISVGMHCESKQKRPKNAIRGALRNCAANLPGSEMKAYWTMHHQSQKVGCFSFLSCPTLIR